MSDEAVAELRAEIAALRSAVEKTLPGTDSAAHRKAGLLGYEGLRARLAIDGKRPCLRTVKALVAKHRRIIRPVPLGHHTVGFRLARVEALLAHLAGDEEPGGAKL